MKSTAVVDTANNHAILIGENIIYLMGISFILGSFFTILILILLDFMKRDRVPREPD